MKRIIAFMLFGLLGMINVVYAGPVQCYFFAATNPATGGPQAPPYIQCAIQVISCNAKDQIYAFILTPWGEDWTTGNNGYVQRACVNAPGAIDSRFALMQPNNVGINSFADVPNYCAHNSCSWNVLKVRNQFTYYGQIQPPSFTVWGTFVSCAGPNCVAPQYLKGAYAPPYTFDFRKQTYTLTPYAPSPWATSPIDPAFNRYNTMSDSVMIQLLEAFMRFNAADMENVYLKHT